MKDYKKVLISFIEIVIFLFASFGGFLRKIAPPDEVGAAYPVGILSFLLLIILMAISVTGRNAPGNVGRKRWTIAGIVLFVLALPACFVYPYMIGHYTYPRDSELSTRQISASDEYLTSEARQYKLANPTANQEDLNQNLPDGHVWMQAGIERAELQLLASYACLVLSLSASIFCLLEANIKAESVSSVSKDSPVK